ncbi:MAG TPA: DivIVA domain-containing protein, partial [Actinomycetota bacterium]|nr:DivIVA domain-containing protein [Actinomycetota bacterium]
MAENDETQSANPSDVPSRITPVDVQQKQFRLAFRGYHEREVDEFLDQVTEELARLHAENRRLQEQLGELGRTGASMAHGVAEAGSAEEHAARIIGEAETRAAALLDEARARAASVATGLLAGERPEDEGLVRFLAREREFLQRLAGLIQDHASSVKRDVRTAREAAVAPPPPAPEPQEWTAAGARDDVVEAPSSEVETVTDTSAAEVATEPPLTAEPEVVPEPQPEPEPVPTFSSDEPAASAPADQDRTAWAPPAAEEPAEVAWGQAETPPVDEGPAVEEGAPSAEDDAEPAPSAWREPSPPEAAPSIPSWTESRPSDEGAPDEPIAEPEEPVVAEQAEPFAESTANAVPPETPEDPPWARIVRPVWEPPSEPAPAWREPEAAPEPS